MKLLNFSVVVVVVVVVVAVFWFISGSRTCTDTWAPITFVSCT